MKITQHQVCLNTFNVKMPLNVQCGTFAFGPGDRCPTYRKNEHVGEDHEGAKSVCVDVCFVWGLQVTQDF